MITMDTVQNLIFDLGDVLISYRWCDMLQDYGLSRDEALRIGNEMFNDDEKLWHEYDLGKYTKEGIIEAYKKEFPDDGDVIAWFIRHGEYMCVPRPQVWDMVHRLKKKGYGIYLLSNYPEDLFYKHTEYAEFMQDLDGMTISYQVHVAKPDKAIYEFLCRQYRLEPEECLFFDDRRANIDAARDFGMKGQLVLSSENLRDDLQHVLEGSPLKERVKKE